jgi:PII-like signaling protein
MNEIDVTMVRVYLTEGEGLLKELLAKLHDEEKVMGVTVFRAISGFGRSGHIHSASLLDLSMNLPIVIEFYDRPEKTQRIINHVSGLLEQGRVVSWPARMK